jgi:hypothetical protein
MHNKKAVFVYIVGIIVGLVMAPVPTAFADRPKLEIIPPNTPSFGMTYAEWAATWWQWEFSLPTSVNPWFDDTGDKASIGQSGPVYFLTGILTGSPVVKRTISIPEGKALFFPIYNSFNDNVGVVPKLTFEELQKGAADLINNVRELHVRIDGINLDNLFGYRVKSAPFADWFPSNDKLKNVYKTEFKVEFSGWNYPVASDGYWLMLAPLPPGNHTINFGATSSDNFTLLDVTYDVNVLSKKDMLGQ